MPSKPGKRRSGREVAVQFLYSQEINPDDDAEAFWAIRSLKPEVRDFAEELIRGVQAHAPEIDEILTEKLENYRLERLASVDRNILRLATHEVLHCPNIPNPVAINEAIEIARRFGSEESSGFVNGLLDGIRKSCAPIES